MPVSTEALKDPTWQASSRQGIQAVRAAKGSGKMRHAGTMDLILIQKALDRRRDDASSGRG